MDFLHALSGIFGLLLVSLAGVVLDRIGWIGTETRRFIPKVVTCLALPPYLFHSIATTFDHADVGHFLVGSLVPVTSIVLTCAIALTVARLTRVDTRHRGLFCASFATSSAVFIGIPMCDALLGPGSIPYALLYYFANAVFFWTAGAFLIASDARHRSVLSARRAWKAVLSPPFAGFAAGLITALVGWEPPLFFMNACRTVGQLTTPLALLYIGVTLSRVPAVRAVSRDLVLCCAGRLLVCPLVTLGVVLLLGVDPDVGRVFVLQAALPAVMQAPILSAHHQTDPEFGALVLTATSVACVFTVPLVVSLL